MKYLRPCLIVFFALWAAPAFAASSDRNAPSANALFDVAMSRGDVLLAAGDNAGAEKQFRAALQQGPQGEARADALHKLGIALAHQRRFAEAEPPVAEAEQIARAGRGGILLADVLRAKTFILYRTGRVEDARAAFREAKRLLESTSDAWRTAGDGATWLHLPSGQRFPETIGPFKRLRRTMLDDTGHNVVVHYRVGPGGWGAILASVYVSVERGVALADEFDATVTEIARQYPSATVVARGRSASGYEAVLDLPPEKNGKIRRTSLTAFETGKTLIRVRASYPVTEAAQRADQVNDLIRVWLPGATRP